MPTPTTLPVRLREATRADLPTIARIHRDGFEDFEIYNWTLPRRHQYPEQFYRYLLVRDRALFAESDVRFMVAEIPSDVIEKAKAERDGRAWDAVRATVARRNGAAPEAEKMVMVGFACWESLGETGLTARWKSERANDWGLWLERLLIPYERGYVRYFLNRVADYASFYRLVGQFGDTFGEVPGEKLLHLQFLITDPIYQGFGIGENMMDWGRKLAACEALPVGLESSFIAKGFYERRGFKTVAELVVEEWDEKMGRQNTRTPVMIWEPKEHEGETVVEDGKGGWKIKGMPQEVVVDSKDI
jgi:ribosomal protein S18 acetylase RimI-like enzyme